MSYSFLVLCGSVFKYFHELLQRIPSELTNVEKQIAVIVHNLFIFPALSPRIIFYRVSSLT